MRTAILCLLVCSVSGTSHSQGDAIVEAMQSQWDTKNYADVKSKAKALLKQKSTKAEGHYWLARVARQEQDFEKALDEAEEAVDIDENNTRFLKLFGQLSCNLAQQASIFRAAGLASDCKNSFEKIAKLNPDDLENRNALIQFYLGAPSIAGGSEEKAMQQAREIAKRDPGQGAQAIANVYLRQKKYDLALQEMDKAIAASADPMPLRVSKGLAYQSMEKWPEARQEFVSVLNVSPDNPSALYQLGRSILRAENPEWFEEGKAAFERYLLVDVDATTNPSKAWASLRLGQLLDKMGKTSEADTHFASAAKDKGDSRLQKELGTRAPR